MKTLLMIESWCFASGILLPRKIRELGHAFILVSKNPDFYSKYVPPGEEKHPVIALADEVLVCDTNDTSALIEACEKLGKRRKIDGILTSCDYYLKAVASVACALGLPSSRVDALDASTNKYLMRVAHWEKQLPSPRFALAKSEDDAEEAARSVGMHECGVAVVKPADMNGSTLVQRVKNMDEMKKAIAAVLCIQQNSRGQARFKGALVEEFIPGEEFSIECCAYRGDVRVLGITDKKLGGRDGVVETGHMFPADIPSDDAQALASLAKDALKAIGYTDGVAHIEARLTPKGPRIIEINPRIGGNYISELVERVKGVSPLTQMVQLALGEEPDRESESGDVRSAAVAFVIPKAEGALVGYEGEAEMAASPGVVRYSLSPVGTSASSPNDNDCYLGYVLTEDRRGKNAGWMASVARKHLCPIIL